MGIPLPVIQAVTALSGFIYYIYTTRNKQKQTSGATKYENSPLQSLQ